MTTSLLLNDIRQTTNMAARITDTTGTNSAKKERSACRRKRIERVPSDFTKTADDYIVNGFKSIDGHFREFFEGRGLTKPSISKMMLSPVSTTSVIRFASRMKQAREGAALSVADDDERKVMGETFAQQCRRVMADAKERGLVAYADDVSTLHNASNKD